jgi:hypothetical protein
VESRTDLHSDLDNPIFFERYEDDTIGLDHNLTVKGDALYIASYTSGTRVLQINRDGNGNPSLEPIAHMDTEPRLQERVLNIQQEERFSSAFLGQWGIYVFDTGTIIATDVNNGLVVMRLSDEPCRGMACNRPPRNPGQNQQGSPLPAPMVRKPTLALAQNHPNPIRTSTLIAFEIPTEDHVVLRVLDVAGREVARPYAALAQAGRHEIQWDGRNGAGRRLPAGMYFVQLKTSESAQTQKLLLVQ